MLHAHLAICLQGSQLLQEHLRVHQASTLHADRDRCGAVSHHARGSHGHPLQQDNQHSNSGSNFIQRMSAMSNGVIPRQACSRGRDEFALNLLAILVALRYRQRPLTAIAAASARAAITLTLTRGLEQTRQCITTCGFSIVEHLYIHSTSFVQNPNHVDDLKPLT